MSLSDLGEILLVVPVLSYHKIVIFIIKLKNKLKVV